MQSDEEPLGDFDIALDNCTDVSIFRNGALLTGTKRGATWEVVGHKAGVSIFTDKIGYFDRVEVLHAPEAAANVLCQADLAKVYPMYEVAAGVRVVTESMPLDFVRRGKRFVMDVYTPTIWTEQEFARMWDTRPNQVYEGARVGTTLVGVGLPVGTVEVNEGTMTPQERKRAMEALSFIQNSGYQSPAVLMDMARHGGFSGEVPAAQDIHRAVEVYGLPMPYHKGRMKDAKVATERIEYSPPLTRKHQIAHSDIANFEGLQVLVSKVEPLGLSVCSPLASHKPPELTRAVEEMQKLLGSRGLELSMVVHDPERSFPKIAVKGVTFDEVAPGKHVVKAERLIQEVKDGYRSVLHSLPFNLPAAWRVHLLTYVNARRNSMFHRSLGEKISPRERFLGRKPTARDFSLGFGDYVVLKTNHGRTNSMLSRSFPGIALYPTGMFSGSWDFINLETGKVVRRNRWRKAPMSHEIITKINALESHVPDEHKMAPSEQLPMAANPVVPLTGQLDIGVSSAVVMQDEEEDAIAQVSTTEVISSLNESSAASSEASEDVAVAPLMETSLQGNELVAGITSSDNVNDLTAVVAETIESNPLAKRLRSGKVYIAKVSKSSSKRMSQKEALRLHKQKALDSMFDQLQVLNDKGTFVPVDANSLSRCQVKKMIRSFMFLSEKLDPSGRLTKIKARLVAMGNGQDRSDVGMDISSPTVSTQSVYAVAAVAAREGRNVIGSAFLNAYVPDGVEVHVVLDKTSAALLCQLRPEYERFLRNDRTMVVKLERALYGCLQSARLWYDLLRKTLEDNGYVSNPVDSCVFNKMYEDVQSTAIFHVDDIMTTCKKEGALEEMKRILLSNFKEVNFCEGEQHAYLGRNFDFSAKGFVTVSMDGYIDRLIEDMGVTGVVASPAANHLFEINDKSPKLNDEERTLFHSCVQRCLYLYKQLRRDIAVAVAFLTTRVREPDHDDMKKLLRLMKYLNGTRNQHLRLGDGTTNGVIDVVASIDASFAPHQDGRSHSGLVIKVADGTVEGKSKKQTLTTKSSYEAELVATSDMSSEVIRTRDFLLGQGYKIGAVKVEQDNKSCIAMIAKGRPENPLTRHINVRFFFVKDRVDAGELEIVYVPTEDLVADVMTKPLQGSRFRALRTKLMGMEC
jgi:hypothetical protein